jgi:hypothetical protein
VLCAVARESGVTDRHEQVRLLGAVMCDRDLDVQDGRNDDADTSGVGSARLDWTRNGPGKALWQLAGIAQHEVAVGA